MTKVDIESLKPGLESDILIAEEVLGWDMTPNKFGHHLPGGPYAALGYDEQGRYIQELPRFTASVGDSWYLVDRLKANKTNGEDYWAHGFELTYTGDGDFGPWEAIFNDTDGYAHAGLGDTPSMAICRAALKAVRGG